MGIQAKLYAHLVLNKQMTLVAANTALIGTDYSLIRQPTGITVHDNTHGRGFDFIKE